MFRRSAVAIVAALVLSSSPLIAETFRNAPSRPLLVMTTYSTTLTLNTEPIDPRVFVNALFIFADRTLIQSFNYSPQPFGIHPQVSSYVRGRIPNAAWNALLAAMIDVRIDAHRDCDLPPVGVAGGPLPFRDTTLERVVRWYGRQGRKNTFTISDGGGSPEGCELEVFLLTDAISNAVTKVTAASTSEYFSVP